MVVLPFHKNINKSIKKGRFLDNVSIMFVFHVASVKSKQVKISLFSRQQHE